MCFQSVLFLFRRMMIKFFRFRQMRQKQQQKTPPSQRLIEFENRNCRFNAKNVCVYRAKSNASQIGAVIKVNNRTKTEKQLTTKTITIK